LRPNLQRQPYTWNFSNAHRDSFHELNFHRMVGRRLQRQQLNLQRGAQRESAGNCDL
jgi:hypothetical protein